MRHTKSNGLSLVVLAESMIPTRPRSRAGARVAASAVLASAGRAAASLPRRRSRRGARAPPRPTSPRQLARRRRRAAARRTRRLRPARRSGRGARNSRTRPSRSQRRARAAARRQPERRPRPTRSSQAEEAGATRQSGARAGGVRSDAEALLHQGLGPVRGRTVLLPVAVLAGARGDCQRGQHPPSGGVAGARTARAPDGPELVPRHRQLGRLGRDVHEHAGGVRRHGGAAGGAGRDQVLRRQRLGGDRARAAVPADPPGGAAGQRRGDHGVRDGRLAGEPRTRLPGRDPVLQHARKQRTQHRHDRAGGGARGAAVPDHRQRRLPAVRADGLRMGARLPARSRTACTPTTSAARASSNRRCGATTRAR